MSSSSSKPIAPLPFNFTSLSLGESTNGSEKTNQFHQLVQLFIKTHTALEWRRDVIAELNELAPKAKKIICPDFRKSTPKETAQKISEVVKMTCDQASPESRKQLASIRASTQKFSCDHETVKTLEALIQYKEIRELCKQWLKNEKSPNKNLACEKIMPSHLRDNKSLNLHGLGLTSLPSIFHLPFIKEILGKENIKHIKEAVQPKEIRNYLVSALEAWKVGEKGSERAAKAILRFFDLPGESYLDLSNSNLQTLPPPLYLLEKRIKELNLCGNDFNVIPLYLFQMPGLEKLDLSENLALGDAEFKATETQNNLQALQLHFNGVKLSGQKHLTSLKLLTIDIQGDIDPDYCHLPKTCIILGRTPIEKIQAFRDAYPDQGPQFVPCDEDDREMFKIVVEWESKLFGENMDTSNDDV